MTLQTPAAPTAESAPTALDAEVFDVYYRQFATLVGQHHTSILPGSVYQEHPGLHEWLLSVRDAYNDWRLTPDQYAAMEALRDWTWVASYAEWLCGYRELEQLMLSAAPPDLAGDHDHADSPVLAWSRTQQLHRDELSPQQVNALERLPGWVWQTRRDRRVSFARAVFEFQLLYRSEPSERAALERLLARDDADLAATLDDPGPYAAQVALATDPQRVSEAALFAEVAEHLPERATAASATFLAEYLTDVLAGTLDVLALTALSFPYVEPVLAAYRSYHRSVRGHLPHEAAQPAAENDRDLAELLGEATGAVLRRHGLVWRSQLRQHTAEEVRALVGETRFVAVLIQTDPDRDPGPAPAQPALAAGQPSPVGPAVADPQLPQLHVAHLNLTARTYNVLMREQLHRVGQLLEIEDPHELLALRGFGETCLVDLRTKLTAVGATPRF